MPNDYCPICGETLVPHGKLLKMKCPNEMCTFKDRRSPTTAVDPLIDRREGTNSKIFRSASDTQKHLLCPWHKEKW